ncbi:MAG: dihydrodipicolinate synthase family protein [Deltaproteobacteria bacterium]|nr:dihydrodipicolinate synthase family protein [Deltaproteobacteria bacterium]
MSFTFPGLIVPPTTPFDAASRIDEKALAAHLEYLAENNVSSILANGTTAEFFSLLPAERRNLLVLSRKYFPGTIYFNTASDSLLQAKEAAHWARESGADAIVAMAPYYYANAPAAGIIGFFKELAAWARLPLILYNFARHTNNPLTAHILKAVPHAAIKDSSGDESLISATPCYLAGTSRSMLEWVGLGAKGYVSAGANYLPDLYVKLEKAINNGDMDSAGAVQNEIRVRHLKDEGENEITIIKKKLSTIIPGYPLRVRLPLK